MIPAWSLDTPKRRSLDSTHSAASSTSASTRLANATPYQSALSRKHAFSAADGVSVLAGASSCRLPLIATATACPAWFAVMDTSAPTATAVTGALAAVTAATSAVAMVCGVQLATPVAEVWAV
ncbi:hypothetical protein G6F63_015529 [Rhizopus arrhizus]|nr:hypothetical protein G6F63_015529 [Rhizopus arrhizus]